MSTLADRRKALEALLDGNGITRVSPPILLPANAYFDLAGEEFGRRLLLTTGSDGSEYCIRPDFTLPIAQTWLLQDGGAPSAYGYLGRIFRQRDDGPAEFDQAGLELLAQTDATSALYDVLKFALAGLDVYGVSTPKIRLGSVAIFEALLNTVDMPEVWRPRLRHRFGHPQAVRRLLERLDDPHGATDNVSTRTREELIETVTEQMVAGGFSITSGRRPEEIADRYLEKQALAEAHVPAETIALLNAYLSLTGPADETITKVADLLSGVGLEGLSPVITALEKHVTTLARMAPGAEIVFDAGFSPRLDYYTGLVFEMQGARGEILASGGEYDRLMQRLGSAEQVNASGCALWVERLEEEVAQ